MDGRQSVQLIQLIRLMGFMVLLGLMGSIVQFTGPLVAIATAIHSNISIDSQHLQ